MPFKQPSIRSRDSKNSEKTAKKTDKVLKKPPKKSTRGRRTTNYDEYIRKSEAKIAELAKQLDELFDNRKKHRTEYDKLYN